MREPLTSLLELIREHDGINDKAQLARLAAETFGLTNDEWVAAGWLVVAQTARRSRAYTLSAIYRQYIGNLSAMPPHEEP
jgi:hypothetical protein